jgi:dTDP-glucose 4,6-dehydratase
MLIPRALIAGGAGFVGSHLSDRMLRDGYEVVVVDNFLTGSLQNVSHNVDNPHFSLIEADARNLDSVPGRFEIVFHLASPASPIAYQRYPIETLHAGSVVTEALLDRAVHDRARFVMASTSEVYGDPLEHPQKETYWGNVNSIGPRSMYDEAKRYAEALIFSYIRSFGANAGVARIFNTYGPRMAKGDGRVIPAFVGAALAGEPLPIHGDGMQTRSLCFVTDLVDGLVRLAHSDTTGPINLGNPHEQTLKEIAERIASLAGHDSALEFHPRPIDDPERRRPDISRAREVLGWEPVVQVDEGLAQTIAWFKESNGNS